MRQFHFKPMPGLTIVTVICLTILISLGTWQYHRLQWKTELLTDIDEAATSEPFQSVSDVQDALARDEPIDFRRIGMRVDPQDMDTPFLVFQTRDRQTVWRPYFVVNNSGTQIFVAGQSVIPDADKQVPITLPDKPFDLSGYVRLARPVGRFGTKSTPDKNRWFGFNPIPDTHDWSDQIVGKVDTRFYIDIAGNSDAEDLPVKRPDIRNNHFDYMLTWYSFAAILLIIYLILHRRAGRLGYKRDI